MGLVTNILWIDLYVYYLTPATTTLTQPPRDMTVSVNDTAFFHCGASYNPALDVTYDWYHNAYRILFIRIRNLGNSVTIFREPNYYRVCTL